MATTLAQAITRGDGVIALAGDPLDPAAVAIEVDSEQLRVVRGDNPLFVEHGWDGTAPNAHDAGATATPLYRTLSSTPGGS